MTAQALPRRVAVDLTGLGPGGENGGARLVALTLVRELSALAPTIEFVLLTASRSHAELSYLDTPNVRRLCVRAEPDGATIGAAVTTARHALRDRLESVVGQTHMAKLRSAYWRLRYRSVRSSTLRGLGADLYFCPLTTAFCADDDVPLVAIVYDLQHLAHPEFFTAQQRYFRQQQLEAVVERATWVACISEHVRASLLTAMLADAERIVTVRLPVLQPMTHVSRESTERASSQFGLEPGHFLLYPANFWPHKNHERLLDAFKVYRDQHPTSGLRLVCTGVLDARGKALRERAARDGLAEWVRFTGYVSDDELAALLQACHALIYPSLYEGFGMPVLEALALRKPVLCSSAGSLPEVAQDAAIYFDPSNTDAIAAAIGSLESVDEQLPGRIERGYTRAIELGTPTDFARQYLRLFEGALATARC